MTLAVSAVALTAGCDRKQAGVSEKQMGEGTGAKEPKQMDVKKDSTNSPRAETVKLKTSMGDVIIELDRKATPVTTDNFLGYVREGFYDGTIFHRVISGFMIQGGGFTAEMKQKGTHQPIVNEAANGLKNSRGTIAMARTNNPNSATSQFFINHRDNTSLDYAGPGNPGYAVFGRVTEGIDVVDKIAAVRTTRKGPYDDVPVEPVVIISAKVVSE